MAGLSKRIWILLIAFGAIPPFAHAAEPPPPVHYDIGLDVRQHEAEALTVRASVQVGDDGIVDFNAPAQAPVELHAEKGSLDTSVPGRWRVTAAPGSDVALTWRTPKPEPLGDDFAAAWHHVVAHDGKIVVMANVVLAIPSGPDTREVTLTTSAPSDWKVASDIGTGDRMVRDLACNSYFASPDLQSRTRPIWRGTQLHVNALGFTAQDSEQIATSVADALNQFGEPMGAPTDLSIGIMRTGWHTGWAASWNGTTATVMVPDDTTTTWLLGVTRNFAIRDSRPGEEANAWFTTGVQTYRLAAIFVDQGAMGNVALARHIDETATTYGNSPLRRAPNARIAADYDRIRDMHDLAATRGELFAWLVDGQMREATQGRKRLTDALKRMDVHATEPGPALIAAVAAEGGGDIAPLYQRYIVDGQLLQLPPDTLGPCFAVGTVAYDYGWQVQHVFAKPPTLCVGADSSATGNVGADSSAKSQRSDDEAAPNRR